MLLSGGQTSHRSVRSLKKTLQKKASYRSSIELSIELSLIIAVAAADTLLSPAHGAIKSTRQDALRSAIAAVTGCQLGSCHDNRVSFSTLPGLHFNYPARRGGGPCYGQRNTLILT